MTISLGDPLLLSRKDALKYLGVSRHLFDQEIRPLIPIIKLGQRIFFRRVDLDSLFRHNTDADGGPQQEKPKWVYLGEAQSGICTKRLGSATRKLKYEKVRDRLLNERRKKS